MSFWRKLGWVLAISFIVVYMTWDAYAMYLVRKTCPVGWICDGGLPIWSTYLEISGVCLLFGMTVWEVLRATVCGVQWMRKRLY